MDNVKVGDFYYYKQQTSKFHNFEGVVKVDRLSKNTFTGSLVYKIENTAGWVTERINLWSEHIVKKITRETHPEYFL